MSDTARRAPVQTPSFPMRHGATIPWDVHMRAYEVYCEVWSAQPALVEGNCRGGFGLSELVGFLYAAGFPKTEWKQRTREAWANMDFEGQRR